MNTPKVTLRRIADMTDPGVEQAVQGIADAFDNRFLSLIDNKRENLEADIRAIFMDCLHVDGEVIFAELPDVGVIGTSAWYGPGIELDTTQKQRSIYKTVFLDRLSHESQAWWNENARVIKDGREKYYGKAVSLLGYNLQLLGTNPKYQKNGAGTALVNYGLEKAKTLGVPAIVETIGEPAINFYRECGFEVQGIASMKGRLGEMLEFAFMLAPAVSFKQ